MSKAKKSPAATTSAVSYMRMIANEKSADARWFGVVDEQGYIVCLTGKPELPTFEDLVDGWMAIPITFVEGRDEQGYPIWRDVWLSRAEAEARVRAAHPGLEPKTDPRPAA